VSELKAEGQNSDCSGLFLLVNNNATRSGIFIHDRFILARSPQESGGNDRSLYVTMIA